jgi:hypothetical protein
MRRYNIVSRIILILTVITFALAAPALVQDKRQACVDGVHLPKDVITVLGKRTLEEDLNVLWDGWWHYGNVLGEPALPPNVHVPPHSPADTILGSTESDDDSQPESPESGHSRSSSTSVTSLANSDRESAELDDDAPPKSSESGHSPPTSLEWSTESEDWNTAPSSLGSSTGSEGWYTAPTSPGSSTESDSDSDRWSTISNAPSAESQSENLKTADSDLIQLKGKAKVSRRISGTASGVDTMNAELRSGGPRAVSFCLFPPPW